MNATRLKIKVGQHEFEAEGPPDVVERQFEEWKALVERQPDPSIEAPKSEKSKTDLSGNGDHSGHASLEGLFALDERRDLITLRAHPHGESKANMKADAVVLLLYGCRVLRHEEEVAVTKLAESARISGFTVGRVDRAVAPHVRSGYVLKGGRGKGGKYRLTNTGLGYAKRLADDLLETIG